MRAKSQEPVILPDTTILALEKGFSFTFEHLNIGKATSVNTDASNTISHPLEGYWSVRCFNSDNEFFPALGLLHFVLSVTSDGSITGFGEAYLGELRLTGTAASSDDGSLTHSLEFKMVIANAKADYFFHGTYNPERNIVTGTWEQVHHSQQNVSAEQTADAAPEGFEADSMEKADSPTLYIFVMRRTPVDVYRFRRNLNLDTATDSSVLAKARWKFAIEATRFQVQTKTFSWDYVRARFAEQRLWVNLWVAFWKELLPDDRIDTLYALTEVTTPSQSRLYHVIASYLYYRDYEFKMYVFIS